MPHTNAAMFIGVLLESPRSWSSGERPRTAAEPLDGLRQRPLPRVGVDGDHLRGGPFASPLDQLAAAALVADQAVELLVPAVVGHEPAALLLAKVGIRAYRRGQPRDARGGVLLDLDVRARGVEGVIDDRRDADVEARELAAELLERHRSGARVALARKLEVD